MINQLLLVGILGSIKVAALFFVHSSS